MELDDFRKDFLETVRAVAEAEGEFEEAAFVGESARRLLEAEEMPDFEPCHYDGTGSKNRKLRVDGYAIDDVDGSVSLLLANYQGSDASSALTQTDANKWFGMLRAVVEDSLSGRLERAVEESTPIYGLATELFHRRENITRFRVFLLTDSILSTRVKDWPDDTVDGRPAEFHIWDIARFHRVFESRVGRDELEIDFTEFDDDGIPCLEAYQTDGEYQSFLCVIPGVVLADIYERYGSRLLEGNVRSFLSTRGKVNKNIRNTVLNEPAMFFAYNNGISATATDTIVRQGKDGMRLTGATYLQIVNGGQTTASLTMARRKDGADLSHIFVQMKLSVITPEKSESVIPRISYCANSQNKVSEADFFSNHPFHVRVEEISRRLWAPAVGGAQHETHWFYERARGQYINEQINLTPAEKRRFLHQNPRSQLLTKTDLAKYENAWRGHPNIVSFGAQKNFLVFAQRIGEEWKKSDATFNEDFFQNAVAKAILFRHTERLVSRQPWYQGGYRANIVAYTVAKLAVLITDHAPGKSLDMRAIWNKQAISDGLDVQLASIAKSVFEVIVTPSQGFQNVTEWCKKELCWQRVQETAVALTAAFAKELIDTDEVRRTKKEAKLRQQVDSGIAAQSEVVKLGAGYWSSLATWGTRKKLLSEEDNKLISIAARIPRMIPTDRQSSALLALRRRMEEEGYQAHP